MVRRREKWRASRGRRGMCFWEKRERRGVHTAVTEDHRLGKQAVTRASAHTLGLEKFKVDRGHLVLVVWLRDMGREGEESSPFCSQVTSMMIRSKKP